VRRGRVRGFIPWLITQRPAVVHKDVLSQADILIAMKLTASQDRDAIGAWIEGQADRQEGKRILGDLPRLQRGEGYLWAPAHGLLDRVSFPPIRTFDSSRTPKRGERLATPRTLAEVDLTAIVAALAAVETRIHDRHARAAIELPLDESLGRIGLARAGRADDRDAVIKGVHRKNSQNIRRLYCAGMQLAVADGDCLGAPRRHGVPPSPAGNSAVLVHDSFGVL
jgi:hypothetical protein